MRAQSSFPRRLSAPAQREDRRRGGGRALDTPADASRSRPAEALPAAPRRCSARPRARRAFAPQPREPCRVRRERLERRAERLAASPARRARRAPPPRASARPGRSGATTASPAIRYSKSLFGAESSAFRVSGRSKSSPTWWPWSAVTTSFGGTGSRDVDAPAQVGRQHAPRVRRGSSGSRAASAARSARAGPPRAGRRAACRSRTRPGRRHAARPARAPAARASSSSGAFRTTIGSTPSRRRSSSAIGSLTVTTASARRASLRSMRVEHARRRSAAGSGRTRRRARARRRRAASAAPSPSRYAAGSVSRSFACTTSARPIVRPARRRPRVRSARRASR